MNKDDIFIKKLAIGFGILIFILALASYVLFSRPADFPPGRVLHIERGRGLKEISLQLNNEGVLSFPKIFNSLVYLFAGQENIKAGDYFFEKPLSLVEIYRRLTRGRYGLNSLKVTILEGRSVFEIGRQFGELGLFSQEEWMAAAEGQEGYLFPDTYFLSSDVMPDGLVKILKENFEAKVTTELREEISRQGKDFREIITMASLIEKEASSPEDARIISGILWKRLEAGMGLQVDAALTHITGKASDELTEKDLTIDSPYNTYKYKGLPPKPIGNPGLETIKAAIYPEKTLYWFYLHGQDGQPHYALTFGEHVANKQKYLR